MKKSVFLIRGVGFVISLILHAVLLYFVFHIQFKIEIFPMDRDEDVFVARLETIIAPEDTQEYLERLENQRLRERRAGESRSADFQDESLPVERQIAAQEELLPSPGSRKPSPDILSGFYLDLPGDPEMVLPEGYSFSLSDPIQTETPSDLSSQRIALLKELAELRDYYPTEVSISPEERRRQVSDSGSHGLSPVIIVDLRPWADQVVKKIQEAWQVPLHETQNIQGHVLVSATINKSGQVQILEITESSGVMAIDHSVSEALGSAVPLPGFPNSFLGDEITVTFEFHYGY
jgi:TonB family protein